MGWHPRTSSKHLRSHDTTIVCLDPIVCMSRAVQLGKLFFVLPVAVTPQFRSTAIVPLHSCTARPPTLASRTFGMSADPPLNLEQTSAHLEGSGIDTTKPDRDFNVSTTTSSKDDVVLDLPSAAEEDTLVQYVVIRRDLAWPTGSVVAQAVHASVAAVWNSRDVPVTQRYCDQPGNFDSGPNVAKPQMHTVVLDAKDEKSLHRLASVLDANAIGYILWRERPEDIVTALASHPYPRTVVKKYFKQFRLSR